MDPLDDFDTNWLRDSNHRRGVLVDTRDYLPVNYFKLFFPETLVETIVQNTNLHAEQFFQSRSEFSQYSRYKNWVPTTKSEMQAYIALQIAMGINNKPELEDYWGTYWLTCNLFCDVMPRNHFELLTTFLHFNDNTTRVPRGQDGYDPLHKVRTILDIVDPLYLSVYSPAKEIALDESMIKYKGRIFFRQYLPAKPTKWGIKTFTLCESETGYALKFKVYTGKTTFHLDNTSPLSMTEQVAIDMVRGFEDKGHVLYMDNFYSSPQLFVALRERGIGACGTVNPRRKFMSTEIQPNHLSLNKGDEPVFMRSETLITCAMMDTKRVHFLSSVHNDNSYDKRVRDRRSDTGFRLVERPVMCEHYNLHMNGVDVLDQKLGSYAYPHKSSKWYMTLFHRAREVALVNGYIIYSKSVPEGTKPVSPRVFRERVIDGLLEGHELRACKRGRPSVTEKPDRLTGGHFIGKYEDPKHRPECIVCSDQNTEGWRRVQTRHFCIECEKPMCPVDCFRIYHTYKDFKTAAARMVHNL